MTQLLTLERVDFRLKPGTTPAQFETLAQATEAPLRRQPGFVSRQLARGQDGQWTDLVVWRDLDAAMAGADAMMQEPAFGPFVAAIDGPSVSMRHDTIAWTMAA